MKDIGGERPAASGSGPRPRASLFGILLVPLVATVIILPFATRARFEGFSVPSASMTPTLLPGDYILVDKTFTGLARGDLVVFVDPKDDSQFLVKRVIGLGGEHVAIEGRDVYVDCTPGAPACHPLAEPYAHFDGAPSQHGGHAAYRIPHDSYFVMADNRDAGEDSRHWGFLPWDRIVGRPLVVYWSSNPEAGGVRWQRLGRLVRH